VGDRGTGDKGSGREEVTLCQGSMYMPRFGHSKYIKFAASLLPREFPHTVLLAEAWGWNNLGASKVTKSEFTVSSYSRLFLRTSWHPAFPWWARCQSAPRPLASGPGCWLQCIAQCWHSHHAWSRQTSSAAPRNGEEFMHTKLNVNSLLNHEMTHHITGL